MDLAGGSGPAPGRTLAAVRFGVTADAHVVGRAAPDNAAFVERFVEGMRAWRPDFVIDLGDLLYHCGEPKEDHLHSLSRQWSLYRSAGCPAYAVLGNHDADWIRRCPEEGAPLNGRSFFEATGMPGPYYSFDAGGAHFIVLDGNNGLAPGAAAGARAQREWLAADLVAHPGTPKVLFSHQELHQAPPEADEGVEIPCPRTDDDPPCADPWGAFRRLLAEDGGVVACFAGHKHRNRWVVCGGVHYITLAATFQGGSFARVTLTDRLHVEGVASQRSYDLARGCPGPTEGGEGRMECR